MTLWFTGRQIYRSQVEKLSVWERSTFTQRYTKSRPELCKCKCKSSNITIYILGGTRQHCHLHKTLVNNREVAVQSVGVFSLSLNLNSQLSSIWQQYGSTLPGRLPALASPLSPAAPHLGVQPLALHLLPPHLSGSYTLKSFHSLPHHSFNLAPCSSLLCMAWWVDLK